MNSPMVSIIIITWNRKDDVLATIQCLFQQAYQNFEIIVVDNGSLDGTVDTLANFFPGVKVIALEKNIGIAARNNGIVQAKGEFIFCLDSDANPGPDTIQNFVDRFKVDPDIGIINTKVLNAATGKIDRNAGWVYSEKDKADQDIEFLSANFSETGCAIRKDVFEKVGLFWERLFFGQEGMEFSLRVLDEGYKILYFPSAVIYHRMVDRVRVKGSQRDLLMFRNCLYIYLVRFPWWLALIFAPMKTGASLVRAANRGYLSQILSVMVDVIRHTPELLRERKPIKNKTAFNYLKLQRQHGQLRWDVFTWLKYKI